MGQKVFYRLNGDDVSALMGSLREVAERHIAEVERLVNTYLTVKDNLEPIPAAELLERARQLLDAGTLEDDQAEPLLLKVEEIQAAQQASDEGGMEELLEELLDLLYEIEA